MKLSAQCLHVWLSLGLAIAIFSGVSPSFAQASMRSVPIPGAADPRVQTVMFKEDSVVALRGHYGYQMMIEFGDDERIENVSIGDSIAWQVTPNRRADTLFVKPVEFDAATNMSVITSKRRYAFQLSAQAPDGPGDPSIIYRVKFSYPPDLDTDGGASTPALAPILVTNQSYSVSGGTTNVPSRVFDDGQKTYFEWPAGAATPAVFAVGLDGSESLVNFVIRGELMVVERVGPGFMLRNGTETTLVRNEAWRAPEPGPDAPVHTQKPSPSSKSKSLFGTKPSRGKEP
jgi:type IV secretion system protein VirB9